MRCTGKKRIKAFSILLAAAVFCTGCSGIAYEMPYNPDSDVSSMNVLTGLQTVKTAVPFASNLCVVTDNIVDDEAVDMSQANSALLCDVNNREVLYAKNPHERLQPASLTKVLTALVAIKNGSPEQVLTASDVVNITESGAQLCGVKSGDTMTLDQALHILLMYSANDVAMMIAENIGGSVEHFVEMMNEEAKRLGATNSNFVNPHGLTDDSHYTTAYDLYLIFNEAIKYETFSEIIHMTEYETVYYNAAGETKNISFRNSNLFLRGDYKAPENVTVMGGKTGTTNAAGHCLILLSKDVNGAPYISVILSAESRDILYTEMTDLLNEISN